MQIEWWQLTGGQNTHKRPIFGAGHSNVCVYDTCAHTHTNRSLNCKRVRSALNKVLQITDRPDDRVRLTRALEIVEPHSPGVKVAHMRARVCLSVHAWDGFHDRRRSDTPN